MTRERSNITLGHLPKIVAISVCPEHDDKSTDETAEVSSADVAVKASHGGKENGRVPQLELGPRKESVQGEDQDRDEGANEEAIGKNLVDVLLEEATRADEHVLDTHSEVGRKRLRSPLMSRVFLGASEVVVLGVKHPADDGIVDRDAQEASEYLREEDSLGWQMHVVADLHILQVQLRAVPGVSSNSTVGGSSGRVLETADRVDHEAV